LGGVGNKEAANVDVTTAKGFVVGKPEEFVFNGGPADGGAEDILAEGQTSICEEIGEEAIGVEFVIAEEFEEGAVELVGAVLEGDVDDGAGGAAIFGGVAGGLDFELLHGVEMSVDGEGDAFLAGAIDIVAGCSGGGAGDESGEGHEVAIADGHLQDCPVVDNLRERGSFRVDEGLAALDGNGFLGVSGLESDIDADGLIDLEPDVALLEPFEAGGFDADGVVPDDKISEQVDAIGAGIDGAGDAGGEIRDGDTGVRDDGAASVGDDAGDAGGGSLSKCCCGEAEQRGDELHGITSTVLLVRRNSGV